MENLGIDLKLIIAQLINFLILFVVFKKFMAKPFLNFIKDERKKEEDKNKLMSELEEKVQSLEKQKALFKQEQKKEMEKTMQEVSSQADNVRQELVKNAEKDAQDILAKAKIQIEEEKLKLEREMKSRLVTVSTMLVEKGLQSFLTEDQKRQVTQNILMNLPKNGVN